MLKTAALATAATLAFTTAVQAGGYDRYPAYAAPAPADGPVTVYNGTAPGYRYDYSRAYPAQSYGYGSGYGSAYAGASAGAYADAYGYGDYGAPWGPPFAGGVGYSPYGNYGGYGYGASVYGARMDPWNGYNWAPGNGYW